MGNMEELIVMSWLKLVNEFPLEYTAKKIVEALSELNKELLNV